MPARSRSRESRPRGPALHQQAAELAALIPFERLHPGAVTAIRARPVRERIAIAVSGGADSVALLLLLWAHFPERRGRWLVLHFNHHLRGRAAAHDAAWVQKLAADLGETCEIGQWTRAVSAPRNKVSEAAARDARWTFLATAMRRADARVIALGHQLNDVAETLLMRLTRGSGVAGLAAPRPVQIMADGTQRLRPLLALSADDLRAALKRAGVRWREDATNLADDYFRNRVRARVLPPLLAAAPQDALAAIADSRALFEEDAVALDAWLQQLAPLRHADDTPHDLRGLHGAPRALVRRAVHRFFAAQTLTTPPGRTVVERVIEAIESGATLRIQLGRDRWFETRDRIVRCVTDGGRATSDDTPGEARLATGGTWIGADGARLELREVRLTRLLRARIHSGEFPRECMAYLDPGPDWPGWFSIRSWRPGDAYRPLGAKGRSKLQDMFVDRRIPRERRQRLPVVVSAGGKVLWVPGLRIADEVAVQPASNLVVQLTYIPAPPMVHRSKTHSPQDVRTRKA